MKEQITNPNRIGQGKKIDDSIEAAIVETLVAEWLSGKRRRQLSAESILDRISHVRPDLAEYLPSPQTVRRVIKPIREKLDEGHGDLDQPWSLGSSISGLDEIDHDTLPVLLRINKHLALDVGEERRSNGFRANRLTIREARWVGKLRKSLPPVDEGDDQRRAPELEATVLADLAKRYATRELVAQILGEEVDTHDLDMEIAFDLPSAIRLGRMEDYHLWMLSLELGLVPQRTISPPGEMLEFAIQQGMDDLSPMVEPGEVPFGVAMATAKLNMRLLTIVMRLDDHGIRIRVPFGTEDWDSRLPWEDGRSFTTHADYEITVHILRLILPLARVDQEVTDADPDQVRIATAFLKKILSAVREKLQDAKVREILGLVGGKTEE